MYLVDVFFKLGVRHNRPGERLASILARSAMVGSNATGEGVMSGSTTMELAEFEQKCTRVSAKPVQKVITAFLCPRFLCSFVCLFIDERVGGWAGAWITKQAYRHCWTHVLAHAQACTHTRTHTCTHARERSECMRMHTCTHVHTCAHTHTRARAPTHIGQECSMTWSAWEGQPIGQSSSWSTIQ